MSTRPFLTAAVLIGALSLAHCGSEEDSPNSPTPGGPEATLFGVFPDSVLLVSGDRGWVLGSAVFTSSPGSQDVTSATRWEPSNLAVTSVQGNIITAVAPGEAEVRGFYQRFSATTRVTVLAPSSVRQFSMPALLTCWPGETFDWKAEAVLDTGAVHYPTAINWRSMNDAIVTVATREVQNSTGAISTDAAITCRSGGSTRFEATYAGRTAVTAVTVRPTQNLIEVRGVSTSASNGATISGVTVFYLLDTVPSATIQFETRDAANVTRILGTSSQTVTRGSGSVSLSHPLVAGAPSNVCVNVTMTPSGGAPIRDSGPASCPGL